MSTEYLRSAGQNLDNVINGIIEGAPSAVAGAVGKTLEIAGGVAKSAGAAASAITAKADVPNPFAGLLSNSDIAGFQKAVFGEKSPSVGIGLGAATSEQTVHTASTDLAQGVTNADHNSIFVPTAVRVAGARSGMSIA